MLSEPKNQFSLTRAALSKCGRQKAIFLLSIAVMLFAMAAGVSQAGTYYVATDGSAANEGSAEHPWPTVNYALEKVGGGNTIIVKPGVYSGVMINKGYAGTAEHPTVVILLPL
jgi:hypothetical protein